MDTIQCYEGATEWALGVIKRVDASQLDDSSVCEEWRVRDLINHMQFGLQGLDDAASGTEMTLEDYLNMPEWKVAPLGAPDIDADATSYTRQRSRTLDVLKGDGVLERSFVTPIGTIPGADDVRIVAADHLIHGWDLAASTGQDVTIPEVFVAFLREMTDLPLYEALRGIAFGDEVTVPDDAPEHHKVLAFFGRDPRKEKS